MGRWINKIIKPTVAPEPEDHIAIEDLARLADGAVDKAENQHFIRHLNRCQRCYEILQETLKDLADEASVQTTSSPWWKTRTAYALAASIILVLLIGGQLVFNYWNQRPQVILATLNLDQQLKDILLVDDALRWEKGERVNRLVAALQQKGLQVKELNLVVLSKPYYQKKSLFGPKEALHIRIENKVAYLEVKEMNQ
ncbi:MAG: hypothetical protein JSV31_12110 [Desulfobacterales bacterium]|nr:MAG: hypothetical protein JSV31_12110 [Desulfobacterales bacterium]